MVTVIIPLYNAETTIEQVLDSIRNQTAFERIHRVIVVNDGSTDGSADVVKRYKEYYPDYPLELVEQENGGAAAARNTGMRMADTKYIAFLDADDIWLPEKLEKQFKVLAENPQIRFLGTNWMDTPLKIGKRTITSLYNGTVKDICIKNFPYAQSVIMERSLIDEVGYFDPSMRHGEDMNYFQKICMLGNYYFMPEKLIQMDIGKAYFAQSGLSSHLKEMHLGTLHNIKELREKKAISFSFWLSMRVFYQLKYYRRCIMKALNGSKKGN